MSIGQVLARVLRPKTRLGYNAYLSYLLTYNIDNYSLQREKEREKIAVFMKKLSSEGGRGRIQEEVRGGETMRQVFSPLQTSKSRDLKFGTCEFTLILLKSKYNSIFK